MKLDNMHPIIYIYKPIKINKQSRIFELSQTQRLRHKQQDEFLTELVRVEKDQGFSKAKDVVYWLRIRNQSNWSKCQTPTGFKKTDKTNVFFGDIKTDRGKTLIIFKFQDDESLKIFNYQNGFYPKKTQLKKIINKL